MIYELSVVTKPELGSEAHAQMTEIVKDALKGFEGELLLADDWGKLHLAQPYANGAKHAHFHYFIYKSNTQANTELARRFGINEGVLRNLIFVIGEDTEQETLVKNFNLHSLKHTVVQFLTTRKTTTKKALKIWKTTEENSQKENLVGLLRRKLKQIGKILKLGTG